MKPINARKTAFFFLIAMTIVIGLSAIPISISLYFNRNDNNGNNQTTPEGEPGVTVLGATTEFSEDGGKGNFTVVLESQPNGTVSIDVSSSDISGAIVDGAIDGILTLDFTANNWNITQHVNLTGINDYIDDGDQILEIILNLNLAATTDTTGYAAIDPTDLTVTVVDDDTAGMTITPGITTLYENYGFGNFTVVLDSEPIGEVVINVVSSDTEEATIDNAVNSVLVLTFSSGNWSIPCAVNISGVNDGISDGEQEVYIIVFPDSIATVDTTGYAQISAQFFSISVFPIHTLIDWEGDDVGWIVTPDNRSAQSTNNLGPTVYYTNVPDTIGPITFIEWTTDADNDFMGCVLGYDPGDIYNGIGTDYVLIYWGDAASSGKDYINLFHVTSGTQTLLDMVNVGWTRNVQYAWTIEYSSTRIQVWINSTLYFDTTGSFDTGYFGFWVYSQANTFFQMVSP